MSSYDLEVNANKSARTYRLQPNTNFSTEVKANLNDSKFYIGFEAVPSAYRRRKINEYTLGLFGHAVNGQHAAVSTYVRAYPILSSWSESAVTYQNKPNLGPSYCFLTYVTSISEPYWQYSDLKGYSVATLRNILNYGIEVEQASNDQYRFAEVDTSRGTNPPKLIIKFADDNVELIVRALSPASGFIPKYSDNLFQWSYSYDGECIEARPTIANSKMRWKTSASATPTVIDCGTALYKTIPANTFTTDTIMWQAEITDSFGSTSTTEWMTLSTVEVLSTAEAISPKDTMVDGSTAQELSWRHLITTGTKPTGADLQKSNDGGATWSTLASVTGSETTATIPANTLSAGEWMWRVRTYNTDNNAGAWSDPASFICVASPIVQGVSATSTPRPIVSWQSDGQKAFQVKIGGFVSDTIYGTAYNYKAPMYLDEGTFEIAVRVQNQYGLWSEWGYTQITVTNSSGDEITLTGNNSNGIAALRWETGGNYDSFLIYRDSYPIAKTDGRYYEDHMAIGNHSYFVRGIYNDSDNYGRSNDLSLELAVESMMISDYKAKSWLALKLTDYSTSDTNFSIVSESTVRKVFASAYPVANISKYLMKTMTARVAFIERAEETMFESLVGRLVIVKTPKGEMVIGPMSSVSKTERTFFNGYSFSITNTYIDEVIEI